MLGTDNLISSDDIPVALLFLQTCIVFNIQHKEWYNDDKKNLIWYPQQLKHDPPPSILVVVLWLNEKSSSVFIPNSIRLIFVEHLDSKEWKKKIEEEQGKYLEAK